MSYVQETCNTKEIEANRAAELNAKLKQISTWEEFVNLEKEMKSDDRFSFSFYGKLRGYEATSFRHMYIGRPILLNKVTYLYGNGVSKGECYIKNLRKVLVIR